MHNLQPFNRSKSKSFGSGPVQTRLFCFPAALSQTLSVLLHDSVSTSFRVVYHSLNRHSVQFWLLGLTSKHPISLHVCQTHAKGLLSQQEPGCTRVTVGRQSNVVFGSCDQDHKNLDQKGQTVKSPLGFKSFSRENLFFFFLFT